MMPRAALVLNILLINIFLLKLVKASFFCLKTKNPNHNENLKVSSETSNSALTYRAWKFVTATLTTREIWTN